MIGFTVFILGLFAILFICEIATKVDTSLKVKKLDRQSQQSCYEVTFVKYLFSDLDKTLFSV